MWPFDGAKRDVGQASAKSAYDKAVDAANEDGMEMAGTFGQATGHWAGKEILIQKRDGNIAEISIIVEEGSPLFPSIDMYVRTNWRGKVESSPAEGFVSILASEDGVGGALAVIKKGAEIK